MSSHTDSVDVICIYIRTSLQEVWYTGSNRNIVKDRDSVITNVVSIIKHIIP